MSWFENIKENVSNVVYSKKFFVIVIGVALLIGLAFYFYTIYVAPRLNPSFVENKELIQDGGDVKNVDVYYFFTEWCPYCKKARPIWDKLKDQFNNKTLNGKNLSFKEIDCEKNEKMADKFNIEGYPTIKLVKGNQVIDYDAKPDEKSLTEFLNTSV